MGTKKAVSLLSGGLDSILAVRLIQEQGIKVTAISFKTPFFGPEKAEKAAKSLHIPLIVKNITPQYLKMLKNPRYGYGSGMNPCNDCHALMIKTAGDLMKKKGYDFIFTGEVLGERPFSQTKESLNAVANLSGYREYLLRPLSAKLLEPTKPEIEGIVDRQRLLDLEGRGRQRQIDLAKHYNIKEYETPAGGCLLTDQNFSKKLRDLLENSKKPELRDYALLRIGRHLRLSKSAKFILGRNLKDNTFLRKYYKNNDILISAENIPGPVGLLKGNNLKEFIDDACRTAAAYSDAQNGQDIKIYINSSRSRSFRQIIVKKEIKTTTKWL